MVEKVGVYFSVKQTSIRHRKPIFQNDRKWSCDSLKEASIQPLHRTVFKMAKFQVVFFFNEFLKSENLGCLSAIFCRHVCIFSKSYLIDLSKTNIVI